MISILHHWGFKRNEDVARDYRTEIYGKTQRIQVPPPPPLEVDENGQIILPSWFTTREKDINEGRIDPYADMEAVKDAGEVQQDSPVELQSQTESSTPTEPKVEIESASVIDVEDSPKDEL